MNDEGVRATTTGKKGNFGSEGIGNFDKVPDEQSALMTAYFWDVVAAMPRVEFRVSYGCK